MKIYDLPDEADLQDIILDMSQDLKMYLEQLAEDKGVSLNDIIIELLKAHLGDQAEEVAKKEIAMPEMVPVENRDFSQLEATCKEYVEKVLNGESTEGGDDEHFIFEASIEAYYGKEIWDAINKAMK